jgi:hypothetical protein
MADYSYDTSSYGVASDLGTWLDMSVGGSDPNTYLSLSQNTDGYVTGVNSATHWQVPFGHLFTGFNDTTTAQAAVTNTQYAEFDVDIVTETLFPTDWSNVWSGGPSWPPYNGGPFTGERMMLGALYTWPEANGRTNTAHYLEINLMQTASYSESLGPAETAACPSCATTYPCADAPYDHCFYDVAGVYAEGKYVSYDAYLGNATLPTNSATWTHVAMPLSDLLTSFSWASPPTTNGTIDWSRAKLAGMYVAVEGAGARTSTLQVKGWNPYTLVTPNSPLGIALGLVRNAANPVEGLISTPAGACGLASGTQLAAYTFNQWQYNNAPLVSLPSGTNPPGCAAPANTATGLVRIGQGAYLQNGIFYCAISDATMAQNLGIPNLTQAFAAAPQIFVPTANGGGQLIYTGACD